jgi:hypothetical protein
MSHTFARFCVFPFIFYLGLFPLGHKRTPLYLTCSKDNCLQNAQNAVSVSASVYSKVPKTKSCLFVDIWVPTCAVTYYLGGNNIVINCVYILVFFTMGSYWPHCTRAGLRPSSRCLRLLHCLPITIILRFSISFNNVYTGCPKTNVTNFSWLFPTPN